MKKRSIIRVWLILLVSAWAAGGLGWAQDERDSVLFQVSTLDALSLGNFQGAMTVAELSRHGDFGIGTFDGLDGEMVMLSGRVYQVRSDGEVLRAGPRMTTPFAAVTRFAARRRLTISQPLTYAQFVAMLDPLLPSKNYFYAIKVEGEFRGLTARSVPRQQPPYPALAAVLAQQTLFPMSGVRGTLAGFRAPRFVAGVNQPGYHFHFLREDERAGGHAIDFEIANGVVEIGVLREHTTVLPATPGFRSAELPILLLQ